MTEHESNAILAEYLRRLDAGESVNVEAICAAHPEIADELRSYVDGDELLADMLKQDAADTSQAEMNRETIRPGTGHSTDTEMVGRMFGRYQIQRQLGQGAMGAVYLAHDTKLARDVALKIPKFGHGDNSDAIARFQREAQAAANLNHPGICPVFDIGEQDGAPYITMGYIDGQPLSRFIGTTQVTPEWTARIIRQIAEALAHAHDSGVVHRDLKAGNVLIDKNGNAIVTDFGLARRVDQQEESRITQDGAILGTPGYMSPEQARGSAENVGPASDLYALGVMLYELLTGELPYRGPLLKLLELIKEGKTKDPRDVNPQADIPLSRLTLWMMSHKIEDRPASLHVVVQELDNWLGEGSSADAEAAAALEKQKQEKLEKYESAKSKVSQLISRGQHTQAAVLLEKMTAITDADGVGYATWAREELKRVQSLPKKIRDGLPALIATAKKLIKKHDYTQANEMLQQVPREFRTPELNALLEKSIDRQDEVDLLMADLQECVRTKQYDGIEGNVKRLLQLKPNNRFAKELWEALNTYSKTPASARKYRFDERGRLLPQRSGLSGTVIGLIAFGLLVFGGMTYAMTLYLKSGNETLTVKIDDELLASGEITLTFDGKDHIITGPEFHLTLSPGDYGYEVRQGNAVITNPQQFTIVQDGRNVLEIRGTHLAPEPSVSGRDGGDSNVGASTFELSAAQLKVDQQNLETIILALRNYHDSHLEFPSQGELFSQQTSWRMHILPFLAPVESNRTLHERLDLSNPWNSTTNQTFISTVPQAYQSAALSEEDHSQFKTRYLVPIATGTVMGSQRPVSFKDISDGTRNTVMLLAVPNKLAVHWASPMDFAVDMNDPMKDFRQVAGQKVLAAMCDGRVIELPVNIEAEQWRRLLRYNDGQIVDWELINRALSAADGSNPPNAFDSSSQPQPSITSPTLVFEDDFSDPNKNQLTVRTGPGRAQNYENGKYYFELKGRGENGAEVHLPPAVANFAFESTFEFTSAPGNGLYAIDFRDSTPPNPGEQTVLTLRCFDDGNVELIRRRFDLANKRLLETIDLRPKGKTSHYNQGDNKLRVEFEDADLKVTLNDGQVFNGTVARDNNYQPGSRNVSLWLVESVKDGKSRLEIDDVKLWQLPDTPDVTATETDRVLEINNSLANSHVRSTNSISPTSPSAKSSNVASEYSNKKVSQHLYFDGINDWIDIPKLKYAGSTPLTLELIATPLSLDNGRPRTLIANFQFSGFGLQIDKREWDFVFHGSSKYHGARSDKQVELNKKTHLAAVFDGRRVSLFVNGKKQTSSDTISGSHRASRYPFMIGADPGQGGRPEKFFHGSIQEVRVSDQARYSADFIPPRKMSLDDKTVAFYDINSSVQGTKLVDLSKNNFDGVIHGCEIKVTSK